MNAEVEAATEETVSRARTFLFDAKGKRRTEEYHIGSYAFQTVLRPETIAETMNPKLGHYLFDWKGTTLVYDAGIGELCLADAGSTPFFDRVLCKVAAVMLDATGSIADPRLRAYVCDRLDGGIPAIGKRGRGRSSKETWGRDLVIIGRLILPLLDRFNATRTHTSKKTECEESACSIVQKALERVRIHMSERRVEGIWEKYARRPH